MTWKERINMCKKLLADVRDMLPEENEMEKELFSITLDNLGSFVSSEAFLENGDEEKEMDSWSILINTLKKCEECSDIISNKLYPNPPKYIASGMDRPTFRIAIAKYISERNRCRFSARITEIPIFCESGMIAGRMTTSAMAYASCIDSPTHSRMNIRPNTINPLIRKPRMINWIRPILTKIALISFIPSSFVVSCVIFGKNTPLIDVDSCVK